MNTANLIPRDRLRAKRQHGRLRAWMGICCVYAGLLGCGYAFSHATWGSADTAVSERLDAARDQIADSTRRIERLRTQLPRAQSALEASRAMGRQPDWSKLLGLLVKTLGEDVVLDGCELVLIEEDQKAVVSRKPIASASAVPLAQRAYRLRLSGYGRTQTAVSQFVLRLEQVELFTRVQLTECNRQDFLGGEAVAFEVKCTI